MRLLSCCVIPKEPKRAWPGVLGDAGKDSKLPISPFSTSAVTVAADGRECHQSSREPPLVVKPSSVGQDRGSLPNPDTPDATFDGHVTTTLEEQPPEASTNTAPSPLHTAAPNSISVPQPPLAAILDALPHMVTLISRATAEVLYQNEVGQWALGYSLIHTDVWLCHNQWHSDTQPTCAVPPCAHPRVPLIHACCLYFLVHRPHGLLFCIIIPSPLQE